MNDIGWAVERMRNNKLVRRIGWNGKGMYIYLASNGDKNELSYIVLRNAQGQLQPGWNASTPDLLAIDWETAELGD